MLCLVRTTVAKNPSPSDAANTAVRYMLRKAGSLHLPSMYDTTRSWGKEAWDDIVSNTFAGRCAYCGRVGQALQVEHLLMTNRTQVGIHHPGNTVPTCKPCNTRSRKKGSPFFVQNLSRYLPTINTFDSPASTCELIPSN